MFVEAEVSGRVRTLMTKDKVNKAKAFVARGHGIIMIEKYVMWRRRRHEKQAFIIDR